MIAVCRALLACGVFASSLVIGAEWVSLKQTEPSALYNQKCGMCHREGGMGTGILARRFNAELAVLENRRDLQPVYIETAVRAGIGIMFPISRAELSDPQLQVVVDYLVNEKVDVLGPPLDVPAPGIDGIPSGSKTGKGADTREAP